MRVLLGHLALGQVTRHRASGGKASEGGSEELGRLHIGCLFELFELWCIIVPSFYKRITKNNGKKGVLRLALKKRTYQWGQRKKPSFFRRSGKEWKSSRNS